MQAIEDRRICTVTYRGKEFIRSETDTEVVLTSTEKKRGRKSIILTFTKDKKVSEESEKTALKMIKQSIISNYQKKQG